MACRERGMALVSILFILALMAAMVLVLTEKVWQATRGTARAAERERTFWAASAGIEWARARLASDYRSSDGWRDYLTGASGGNYPPVPVLTTSVNGIPVELYLRDNPDGDGDASRDNDLRLYLLARARGPRGSSTQVEALCGFADIAAAADRGSGTPPGPTTAGTGVNLPELAAEPQIYQVDD